MSASSPQEIAIARIPAGQSINLFSAVGELLHVALGGAMLAPGNGGDVAATIVAREGQTEQQATAELRRAANVLTVALPRTPAVVEESELEESTTVERISRDETGWTASVGGAAAQAAAEMAQQMLAAFIPAFEEQPSAGNYLSWDAVHEPTGKRYSLIVVRPNGLTPHEARQRAEQESERLRGQLKQAVKLLNSTIDEDPCQLDHNARIKRFVAEHAEVPE